MLGESVWETDARDCRYFNPSVDGLKYHTILTASERRLFREETKPMRDSFGADRREKRTLVASQDFLRFFLKIQEVYSSCKEQKYPHWVLKRYVSIPLARTS